MANLHSDLSDLRILPRKTSEAPYHHWRALLSRLSGRWYIVMEKGVLLDGDIIVRFSRRVQISAMQICSAVSVYGS